MATITRQPLLSSPSTKTTTTRPCKLLFFSLSLVAVISITAFIILLPSTTTITHPLTTTSLCTTSPDPNSCHVIVSEALNSNTPITAVEVVKNIISRSLQRLEVVVNGAGSSGDKSKALDDCVHLMDLSRPHLLDTAEALTTGDRDDVVTWLSAVLTNHDTCLDALREEHEMGPKELDMETHVKELMAMASASLAVLSSTPTNAAVDHISRPLINFPSWVTFLDRRLLEATSVDAVKADVVVAKDNSGNFSTVQAAVDAAPSNSAQRYVIYVKKGTYTEQVQVGKSKKNIMVVGDGKDATMITGSLNVIDGSTTFNSATLIAEGDGFILQDIGVQNTAGPQKHQAVALRTSADKTVVNRCRLDAYQDTLYAHNLRQFFRDSTISGTVDFIFGNAAVVFQNCDLVARKPMSNQQNLVTAQGRTDPNQNTGTSVQKCRVIASSDLAPVKGSIPSYLGRPWKEYSRTVFMQSYIDNHIVAKGWLEWSGDFALKTLYYGEYSNSGPGAGVGGRVKWPGYQGLISSTAAMRFTVGNLIQGGSWLGATGVAFTEGL